MSVYDNARRALPYPLRAKGRSPLQPGAACVRRVSPQLPIARRSRRARRPGRSTRAGAGRPGNASRPGRPACSPSCNRWDCPRQMAARSGAVVMGQGCQERLQFGGRHLIERGQWLHAREHKGNLKGTEREHSRVAKPHGGNRKGTLAELLGNKAHVRCWRLQPSRSADAVKSGRNTPLGSPNRSVKAPVLRAICGGPTVLESLHTIRTSCEEL